jgi:peptidoglycan hydrolase-like protein with peptidoglycan-binding domain
MGRRGAFRSLLIVAVLAVLALAAAIVWWSGASLVSDRVALARVDVQPLGGSLVSARAFRANGKRIELWRRGGRLLPRTLLSPGEQITVVVVVRRPSWLSWALGARRTERLSLRTPVAAPTQRWLTIGRGGALRVAFSEPVSEVAYGRAKVLRPNGKTIVALPVKGPSGSVEVAGAARSWERLGRPVRVTWFPRSRLPVVLASPAATRPISPRDPIRLTFSRPVQQLLGDRLPRFTSSVPGSWRTIDSHTIAFTPQRFGWPFASSLRLVLPRELAVSAGGRTVKTAHEVSWNVAGAEFLRLQQLLAEDGYLPLNWRPAAAPVARQPLAEVAAAVNPPAGTFTWRYPNTPPELSGLWTAGRPNEITRGAVMMFEDEHDLAVDGIAGAQVWRELLTDAIKGARRSEGYSYVYVHRNVPQLLTLWHNGQTVLTSPGNTGVPAAPTQLGTFPVFEHIPVGTMSGTNPDGSHYNDPGIRWISYFHGGDALHAFTRASFGTPQSLGCVELPLATAARVWPYTPIGTLVTIED